MYVLFTEEEYFNEEKKLLRIDGCCHVDNFRGGGDGRLTQLIVHLP